MINLNSFTANVDKSIQPKLIHTSKENRSKHQKKIDIYSSQSRFQHPINIINSEIMRRMPPIENLTQIFLLVCNIDSQVPRIGCLQDAKSADRGGGGVKWEKGNFKSNLVKLLKYRPQIPILSLRAKLFPRPFENNINSCLNNMMFRNDRPCLQAGLRKGLFVYLCLDFITNIVQKQGNISGRFKQQPL